MNEILKLAIYILIMAGVTYLIRMLPFVLFRKRSNPGLSRIFCITYRMPY